MWHVVCQRNNAMNLKQFFLNYKADESKRKQYISEYHRSSSFDKKTQVFPVNMMKRQSSDTQRIVKIRLQQTKANAKAKALPDGFLGNLTCFW